MVYSKSLLSDLLGYTDEKEIDNFIQFHSSITFKTFFNNKHPFFGPDYFFNLLTTLASVEFKSDRNLYTLVALFTHSIQVKYVEVLTDEYIQTMIDFVFTLFRNKNYIDDEEYSKLVCIVNMMSDTNLVYSDIVFKSDVSLLQDVLLYCSPIHTKNGYVFYYSIPSKIIFEQSKPKPSTISVLDGLYTNYKKIQDVQLKSAYRYKIKLFQKHHLKNK